MSVKTAMDATFAVNVTTQSVHEFWRTCRDIKATLDEGLAKLNAIASDPKNNFNTVDVEIVTDGSAILAILLEMQTQLNAHNEFLQWVES